MNKFIFGILFFISINLLHAEIFESDQIGSALTYVNPDTLVLLDITSTLYEPSVIMADKRWRTFFGEQAKRVLGDTEEAQKLSDKVEGLIVLNVPKQLLEPGAPAFVKQLQDRKIPAFGLTMKRLSTPYAPNFGELTSLHLIRLGIDLQKSLAYTKVNPINSPNFTFAYGMIFTNKKPLGPAVEDFLNALNKTPTRVLVIENSLDHLKEIESVLAPKGIEFVGIRYNRGDAKKAQFDPVLGIIQLLNFAASGQKVITSDQEAQAIKVSNPQIDWTQALDQFIHDQASFSGEGFVPMQTKF